VREVAEAIAELTAILAKFFILWIIAGFIVTGLSLLWVVLTGGFVDVVTELVWVAVLESFPFPFNLIITWHINPIALMAQVIVFALLVFLTSRD